MLDQWSYEWVAFNRDGSSIRRYNPDGSENRPDPWETAQFHLTSVQPGVAPVSLYVPRGCCFRFTRRTVMGPSGERAGSIFVAGWELPDEPGKGCFVFCLPDGRFELAGDFRHTPRLDPVQ